jgi:chemotaxis protein CheX
MSLTAEDLGRVVRTVWSTQLGLELEAEDPARAQDDLKLSEPVVISARFHGGYDGTLTQACSLRLSELAGAAAFAAVEGGLDPVDVRDTMTELANVTSGNLKSLLPSPCQVSISEERSARVPLGPVVAEVGFRFDGEPLLVTLIRRVDQ